MENAGAEPFRADLKPVTIFPCTQSPLAHNLPLLQGFRPLLTSQPTHETCPARFVLHGPTQRCQLASPCTLGLNPAALVWCACRGCEPSQSACKGWARRSVVPTAWRMRRWAVCTSAPSNACTQTRCVRCPGPAMLACSCPSRVPHAQAIRDTVRGICGQSCTHMSRATWSSHGFTGPCGGVKQACCSAVYQY